MGTREMKMKRIWKCIAYEASPINQSPLILSLPKFLIIFATSFAFPTSTCNPTCTWLRWHNVCRWQDCGFQLSVNYIPQPLVARSNFFGNWIALKNILKLVNKKLLECYHELNITSKFICADDIKPAFDNYLQTIFLHTHFQH